MEKRRQALQEQQRKEQERLAAIEREEQERKVNIVLYDELYEYNLFIKYLCKERMKSNWCDSQNNPYMVLFACFRSVNAWSRRGDDSRNKKNSWRNKEN